MTAADLIVIALGALGGLMALCAVMAVIAPRPKVKTPRYVWTVVECPPGCPLARVQHTHTASHRETETDRRFAQITKEIQ